MEEETLHRVSFMEHGSPFLWDRVTEFGYAETIAGGSRAPGLFVLMPVCRSSCRYPIPGWSGVEARNIVDWPEMAKLGTLVEVVPLASLWAWSGCVQSTP